MQPRSAISPDIAPLLLKRLETLTSRLATVGCCDRASGDVDSEERAEARTPTLSIVQRISIRWKGVIMTTNLMVTTTFNFDGYKVSRHLGVVRGITVRSRSIVGSFGASVQQVFGGNISIYTELCEQARQEAFELMMQHAQQIGANAVIGMRYDANEISDGVAEVLAYGTAVVVEPAQ